MRSFPVATAAALSIASVLAVFPLATADHDPGSIEVLEATYRLNDHLWVLAAIADEDGVVAATVTTPLGNGSLTYDPVNATWRGHIPVSVQVGTFPGTLTARDATGATTSLGFTFTIGGAREVLFERTIATRFGAYADVDTFLFPRVHDARIEICVEHTCGSDAAFIVGTSIVVTYDEETLLEADERACARPSQLGADCAFDVRDDRWRATLAWEQVGDVTAFVRITGIRV